MSGTIAGVDLSAFAKKPTPLELADIIANWDSRKQAEFLAALGERLRFRCGFRVPFQWEFLANDLRELEAELLDESGSELINELAARLTDTAVTA